MHALHRILIELNDYDFTDQDCINRAESYLDYHEYRVWDYYKRPDSGWWARYKHADKVSELGVIRDKDAMLEFIEEAGRLQEDEIKYRLEELGDKANLSLKDLVSNPPEESYELWKMFTISELLYGEYTFDSLYYDSWWGTAKVRKETLDEIKKRPDDFALVLFDVHY